MSGREGRERAFRRKAKWASLQRRSFGYEQKTRVLIVGEGRQTEPNYFRGLYAEQSVRDRYHVVIKEGKGFDALATVNLAVKEKAKRQYDKVFAVFDVEGPAHAESLLKAMELARKHGIVVILSNPSFEVWLLAHFERTSKSFASGDAVIAALNVYWRNTFRREYTKSDDQLYELLKNRTALAIRNARDVHMADHRGHPVEESNSSTAIHTLVSLLLGP